MLLILKERIKKKSIAEMLVLTVDGQKIEEPKRGTTVSMTDKRLELNLKRTFF